MYCGIDLGSSAIKCACIDQDGRLLASAKATISIEWDGLGRPVSDTVGWRLALRRCVEEIRQRIDYKAIQAVAVSGNGPSLVCAGPDGQAQGPASLWLDNSANEAADRVRALAMEAGLEHHTDGSFYLPKVLRAIAEGAQPANTRFFSAPEYLAFLLGAEPVSYMVDDFYEPYIWFRTLHAGLGLEAADFPPYVPPGRVIGSVTAKAEEEFGLAAGTPLVSAFPDFLAALLGSGVIRPGMACDRAGSSEAINLCMDHKPEATPLFCLPQVIPGLWNVSGGVSASGRSLEWACRSLGLEDIHALYRAAEQSPPGARGLVFLPYLDGERAPLWNPALRGGWIGLHSSHGVDDLARAVLEGIAYGLCLSVDRMRDLGQAPEVIRLSGAAARNGFMCRLKADILERPLETLAIAETELVGNACACALALGEVDSLAAAAERLVRVEAQWQPEPGYRPAYEAAYGRFKACLELATDYSSTLAGKPPITGPQEGGRR